MTKLVFVDTETTSLDADTGQIWEAAFIERPSDPELIHVEHRFLVAVDLIAADPISLSVGRFHDRHPQGNNRPTGEHRLYTPNEFAEVAAALTHSAHLVGNVVSFDEERLRRLVLACGRQPSWHYHLVDVEALVAGRLGIAPPWKSSELSEAIGVALPSEEDRHTAMGDARWARDLYDAVMAKEAD